MPQPTVYLLPWIFRGHAETLVSFLSAETTSCEFAQRQTPLMILVCPAVVVWTVRLEILVERHATEYEGQRPHPDAISTVSFFDKHRGTT